MKPTRFISALLALTPVMALAQLAAFPGAEGYGALASGGRGGSVYHVTTLADSGPGSFRDAVSQPNRTIVFDVGGTIALQSRCYATNNLTIAGQTAPGQGICIYSNSVYFCTTALTNITGTNYVLSFGATNVICRHVRFRQGVKAGPTSWSLALINTKNCIVDHCSIELGDWQTLAIQGSPPPNGFDQASDVTIQNCIVGAGLNNQMGCLMWNATNVTFHHTLWIDDGARDPKPHNKNAQIINDVVYNPSLGIYTGSDTNDMAQVDFIGNYHISGPNNTGSQGIFINPSRGNANVYFTNNLLDRNVNGQLDGSPLVTNSDFNPIVSATVFCIPPVSVTMDSPMLAYFKVGSQAGCSLARDLVDNQLVSQLLSLGTQGQYYTNENQLSSMTLPTATGPLDTDQDGMPDMWELAVGSNYQLADNNVTNANGYTQLENYLNWLGAPHLVTYKNTQSADFDLWPLTVTFTNQTPIYTVFNLTNGTVTLFGNRWVRFVPATNFIGLGSFTFSVTGTNGTSMTNQVGVLVTPLSSPTNLIWRGDYTTNIWNLYLTSDWFNGTALQPFNGDDNVIFDDTGSNSLPVNMVGQLSPASVLVNATRTYTFGGSGSLVGSFALTKTNSGTLVLANTNSFTGGLVINGGTVVASNNIASVGGSVITLNGGSLNEATINLTNSLFNVGTNTWTISGSGNVQPGVALNGGGTLYLNPTCSGVFTPAGDWSQFAGTISWAPGNGAQCRFYGTSGSSNAWFDLGTSTAKLYNRNGSITVQLGALSGGPATVLTGASSYASPTTYAIGARNADSIFNGQISDNTGVSILLKVGTGTLTLAGTNTYSGTTTISNGTLQVNGSLSTNTVTVAGGTLSGSGVINGPVTVLSGATISPGSNSATTGTLTVSNSVILNSGANIVMHLNQSALANDLLVVRNSLALNGTIIVTNIAGTLAAGDSFKLFSAGSFTGNFSTLNLPALAYGLAWKTNALATNGVLSVINIQPCVTTISLAGTNFIFSGTNGTAGASYYLLGSTNLASPLANWTRLATNHFDASGVFQLTNVLTPDLPARFFQIQVP